MKKNIYEEQNILKAVLLAAIPAMLGQVTTLIYNIADTYFVSLTKSPAQIAAVTLCTPILLIIMSIANVFGSGGGSLIARYLGADHVDDVKTVSSYCFYCSVIAGILFGILGFFTSSQIARICGADSENIQYTIDYLKYIFLGAPFIMLFNGMQNVFRSAGYIRQSTIGLFVGNGTNIVLDFVFIVIFHMGTAGAALATSLGFLLSSVYYVGCMYLFEKKGEHLLPLSPKHFKPSAMLTADVCKIGIPGALVTILLSMTNIVLNNYIAKYSSDAVAAYGITYKIYLIPIMLSVGISIGIAPLIGFNYGSKAYHRMRQVITTSNIFGAIFGIVFLALYLLFSETLTGVFLSEEELIQMSAGFLRTVCLAAPFLGVINIVTAYFQAIGKALPSLAITLLRNVVLFLACIVIFNQIWGLNGVIAAQPTVEIAMAFVCGIMYIVSIKKIIE